MNMETERRFLLANDDWRDEVRQTLVLRQAYLSVEKERTVRIRICEGRAWLTIKGFISDVTRSEFEYEIPVVDAELMMREMGIFSVEKHRHLVDIDGFVFEIDEFFGENAPLVLCELELPDERAAYPKPRWLGREITGDGRFTNAYLSRYPYGAWAENLQAA